MRKEHNMIYYLEDDGDNLKIVLPTDYREKAEDKFFIVYTFNKLIENIYNYEIQNLTNEDNDVEILGMLYNYTKNLSNSIGGLLKNDDKVDYINGKIKFDVKVESYGDLLLLPDFNIIYGDGIFEKTDGFAVYVANENRVYVYDGELKSFLRKKI